MAEPKKKLSKTRTNRRRAQYKAEFLPVNLCSHCQAAVLPHHVCPKCGYYNGQPVRSTLPTKRIVLDSEK